MPRDGAVILADVRAPTLSIVCERCGRRGRYNVAKLMNAIRRRVHDPDGRALGTEAASGQRVAPRPARGPFRDRQCRLRQGRSGQGMVRDIGGELMRQGGRMDRVKEQMVLIVQNSELPDEELVKLPVQPGVVTFVKLMPYWEAK